MIKLLIGGSPCTFWSIAQKNGRETKAEGLGWELFKNYLIAKEKFNPDFFLYENNESAAPAIKEQIAEELNTELMYINSSLVSAQNRRRFYVFNWDVEQPQERGIVVSDILELSPSEKGYEFSKVIPINLCDNGKSRTVKAQYNKNGIANFVSNGGYSATAVAEPIRLGDIGSTAQAHRVYSCSGKSVTINAGGGQGGKTGLYLCPTNGKQLPVYEVSDGLIDINQTLYPIALDDGCYVIRKLTPLECERLQTLPDNYTFGVSNAQRYRGCGNGWTAEVIIHILNGILKDIPRDEEIVVLSMYDGIGTGRYCLDKMGFTNIKYYAYEIDKYAKQIANKNYPDIIQMGDAFDVRNPDWSLAE